MARSKHSHYEKSEALAGGLKVVESHGRTRRETLANGLQLIWLHMSQAQTVHVAACIRAGAHYETAESNGVSHLLEHLHLTSSTKHSTRKSLVAAFANIPGYRNAHTHHGMVQFDICTLPGNLAEACEYMAEVLEIREFDRETIRAEKKVLAVEMRESHDGTWECAVGLLFGMNDWGLSQGGTEKSIPKITDQHVHEFEQWAFCPSRMVVVIAGSCTEDALDAARRTFGKLPIGKACPDSRNSKLRKLPCIRRVRGIDRRSGINLQFVISPPLSGLDYLCLKFLGHGMVHSSSPLYDNLRYGRQSLYHVFCHPFVVAEHWVFPIYAYASRRQQHWFAEAVVFFLTQLAAGLISTNWLEQVRNSLLYWLKSLINDPSARADQIASDELLLPEHLRTGFEEEIELVGRLTAEDLVRFAKATFRRSNLSVLRTRRFWESDRKLWSIISKLP